MNNTSQQEINQLGQFIPMHYHYQMLSDKSRMDAFRIAIEQVVKPHQRVAELGSGTGVLSFFAARQGAHVWTAEFNPALVAASRRFISDNGFSDRVKVFEADASNWLPPEPVDLVICEMLHSALLREKQVQVISAFRDAHISRFGRAPRILPNATLLGLQPVLQNYDFNGYYAPVPLFQSAYEVSDNCSPSSDPIVYKIVDYDNAHPEKIEADIIFPFKQDTKVNALRFITKSLLTIDLSTGKTVDWHSQYIILPLSNEVEMKAGQTMRVRFKYLPGDQIELLTASMNIEVEGMVPKQQKLYLIA